MSKALQSLAGNIKVRCALCPGDPGGTVEAREQKVEAGGWETSQKRRRGLVRQGSGDRGKVRG